MESIIPILGVFLFVVYLANRLNKKEDETVNHQPDEIVAGMSGSQKKEEMNKENEIPNPDTLGLMLNTLNQLGCQPTANEEGTISVRYQGENFHMEFGGMYARVWNPMWAGVRADDPDMPKIREAVNAANFNFGPTVVMSAPDEDGVIGLHSRRDIMLHPACPDNVPFVKAVLDSFFDAKEHVRSHFQQINSQQQQEKKPRRPVGFTTNTSPAE